MNTKFKIKEILKQHFNFNGDDNELIYNSLDSVKYFKYMLILEKEFNISLDGKNISTINKTIENLNV
jgi:acyl carrier protein